MPMGPVRTLKSDLPPDVVPFPRDPVLDPAALHRQLRSLMDDYQARAEADPFGNPILRMALELTRLVDRNELSTETLAELIRHMTEQGFVKRAQRIRAYVGETGLAANKARLREMILGLARAGADGDLRPFAEFRTAIEQFHYGIVFTAHPTFSMPHVLGCLLAQLASGADGGRRAASGSETDAILEHARTFSHRPPSVTLADEFASALDAIGHAVEAVGKLHEIVLDVARELYPREWSTLVPRLVSLASWVGYDHDGRSDIGWADTLRIRLKSKRGQLVLQIKRCTALLGIDRIAVDAGRQAGRAPDRILGKCRP